MPIVHWLNGKCELTPANVYKTTACAIENNRCTVDTCYGFVKIVLAVHKEHFFGRVNDCRQLYSFCIIDAHIFTPKINQCFTLEE